MDEERRRILRMLAEGKISTDECDELLEALTQRREAPRPQDVIQPGEAHRPSWPYALLVILGALAVGVLLLPAVRAWHSGGFSFHPNVFPLSGGAIRTIAFIFWLWMIVDCLGRARHDFRLLFTQNREHEKWIWIAIVILANWGGALAYFILIRQPAREIAPPPSVPAAAPAPSTRRDEYVPLPRARSLKGLAALCIVIAVLFSITPLVARFYWTPHFVSVFFFGIAFLVAVGTIFWLCMLISCIARDYREFGTLITSDRSADKLLWLLIIFFTWIIGAIAYHIAIRRRVRTPAGQSML